MVGLRRRSLGTTVLIGVIPKAGSKEDLDASGRDLGLQDGPAQALKTCKAERPGPLPGGWADGDGMNRQAGTWASARMQGTVSEWPGPLHLTATVTTTAAAKPDEPGRGRVPHRYLWVPCWWLRRAYSGGGPGIHA